MAIILEFRRKEEAPARAIKRTEGSLGEIIIFPGVRIERKSSGDAPPHTQTPSGRRVQRARKK
jgi:hypothetical protein